MRKKTVVLTGILSVAIFLSIFTANGMAEKSTQGAFVSDKSDRSLIKEVLLGQQEIKAMLQGINQKIDGISTCK